MNLHNLLKQKGTNLKKKRVGRGYGSGKGGHTTGLGTKGQKARGGGKVNPGFEGGQVPLYKRIPKLHGFVNHSAKDVIAISLTRFNRFNDGAKVFPADLVKLGIIKRIPRDGVKIIQNGNLYKKLEFNGFMYSKGAKSLIEKSGSKIVE